MGENPLVLKPPLIPNVNVNTLGASVLFSSGVDDPYTASYNLLAYRSLNSNPDTLAENISDTDISIPYSGHQMLVTQYVIEACNLTSCSRSAKFSIQQDMLNQLAYIKGFSSEINDRFGFSVALSADGTTLAVGAVGESGKENNVKIPSADVAGGGRSKSGAVFVYKRASGVWIGNAYIKAFNSKAGDNFGRSVTLSADGNTLAVGAYWESGGQNGVHQLPSADDADTSTPLLKSGAVYVYQRENGTWKNDAYIKAFNSEEEAWFGRIVTLSADGNILAVGAYGEDGGEDGIPLLSVGEDGIPLLPVVDGAVAKAADSGAVYMYDRASGAWQHDAYIKAFSSEAGDEFGRAVTLSADGNTLVVGAYLESGGKSGVLLPSEYDADATPPNNRSGAMYVYQRVSGVWQRDAYIKAFSSGLKDWFGMSAALSADGNTLAVGAHRERGAKDGVLLVSEDVAGDSDVPNAGAVYVYNRFSGVWKRDAYIKAFSSEAEDQFGGAVALSADGSILAVGAQHEASPVSEAQLPPIDDADADAPNSGAVYVYHRISGAWQHDAYIKAFSSEAGDFFGASVALSADGNTLAVGASQESDSAKDVQPASVDGANADASSSGAVFVY